MPYPSVLNIMAGFDSQGKALTNAETLTEKNDINRLIPFFPTNEMDKNTCSDDASFPTPKLRLANEGIESDHGEVNQIEDVPILLENHLDIDPEKLKRKVKNKQDYIKQQIRLHKEGFMQKLAGLFFTGDNSANPREFNGAQVRYSTLPTTAYDITDPYHTVISGGGGDADNASIYFFNFGKGRVHAIFPQGTEAGLKTEDMGMNKVVTAVGNTFYAMCYKLTWRAALVVNNRNCVSRIANIKTGTLARDASAGAKLLDLITEAKNNLDMSGGMVYGFTSRLVRDILESQIDNKSNVYIKYGEDNFLNRQLPMVKGIPILASDSLGNAEAAIT